MGDQKRDREEKTIIVTPELPTKSSLVKDPFLIIITGSAQGKTIPIDKNGPTVIGRDPSLDVVFDSNECSRRHSKIYISESGIVYVEDLGSTNGTFVNGRKIDAPHGLEDGDRINIGNAAILKFQLQDSIDERFSSNLYESATRDPLTDIYNKKYFLENLDREFRQYKRHEIPLSLIMFDLDHFKNINDTYGHPSGDEILKAVSKVVGTAIRKETVFARYGGEEFAIILTSTTMDQATILAERLRELVENCIVEHNNNKLSVTISLGVAFLTKDLSTSAQLIEYADQALYDAKSAGRNRVRQFNPPES